MEYVLDPRPPPLTLAQKLGLVEVPRPLLTERQWVQVKAASNSRQDFALPCPICQEDFGLREQVRHMPVNGLCVGRIESLPGIMIPLLSLSSYPSLPPFLSTSLTRYFFHVPMSSTGHVCALLSDTLVANVALSVVGMATRPVSSLRQLLIIELLQQQSETMSRN